MIVGLRAAAALRACGIAPNSFGSDVVQIFLQTVLQRCLLASNVFATDDGGCRRVAATA